MAVFKNKILLENDKVRVLNTTFQPQEKAPMHHHPDTIVYVLSGGKLAMKTKDKTDTFDFQKDKATYLSETTHEVENIGSTTVDLIVVELKK